MVNNKKRTTRFHLNLNSLVNDKLISELKIIKKNTYSFRLINQTEISGVDSSLIKFSDFHIQVEDNGNKHPSFKMISPEVKKDCPHIYKKTDELCLFHPSEVVWQKNMIRRRIILILYYWMYNYILWEKTKIWYGKEYKH